jgi:hypothetical protein
MLFGKKKEKKVMEAVNKVNESTREETKPETVKPVEEWIWVEGYKGTDKDMKCRDYQYTLGELHNMPNDAKIEECESGFHMCRDLKDVFKYYDVGRGNRFFKVRALVRKSDYERYGQETARSIEMRDLYRSHYLYSRDPEYYDKMAARSIVLEEELTVDDIFRVCYKYVNDWDDKYKKLALTENIRTAKNVMQLDKLTELGYSETFARLIIADNRYDVAESVGSQPDLSMDMKCWLIFKN